MRVGEATAPDGKEKTWSLQMIYARHFTGGQDEVAWTLFLFGSSHSMQQRGFLLKEATKLIQGSQNDRTTHPKHSSAHNTAPVAYHSEGHPLWMELTEIAWAQVGRKREKMATPH